MNRKLINFGIPPVLKNPPALKSGGGEKNFENASPSWGRALSEGGVNLPSGGRGVNAGGSFSRFFVPLISTRGISTRGDESTRFQEK